MVKTCTKCGETKPLEDFGRDKRSRDGRTARCKECINAYTRAWHHRDIEQNRAKKRAYLKSRGEVGRAAGRESARRWRAANPEKARAKGKRDRERLMARNPDYFREWYQQNLEKERERARKVMQQQRLTKPEREREKKRRYRARNAAAVRQREREKTYSRRAKQPYSPELAAHMAALVLLPCTYCGSAENITIDHIIPLSRGGKHVAENLAAACYACNSSKGNRLLSEWPGRHTITSLPT